MESFTLILCGFIFGGILGSYLEYKFPSVPGGRCSRAEFERRFSARAPARKVNR